MRKSFKEIYDLLKIIWQLERIVLILTFFCSLISAVTPFIGILLSAYILDALTAGIDMQNLIINAVLAVSGIFLLTVLNAYMSVIKEVHTDICCRKYNMKIGEQTLRMDYELLNSPLVNDILARIRNDNNWGGFYHVLELLPQLSGSLIGFITSVIILFPLCISGTLFHNFLFLLLLSTFALIIIGNGLFAAKTGKNRNTFLEKTLEKKRFSDYFLYRGIDYASGKDIRLYHAKSLIKKYCDSDFPGKDYLVSATGYNAQIGFSGGFSSGLLMTASYLFVVLQAVSGAFGIGSVVKYASTIYQFATQLNNTISAFTECAIASGRQRSTLEYINVPDVLYKGSLPVEKREDNEYEIAFHNVSFRYPGTEKDVLKNVSLKFKIGKRLAVVGMNGSGKTTMIKLLCRLYDPTEGEITLNGINIKKYRYEEYMQIFSVVFQDFKLFSFSLGQNVAANVNVDKEKAKECLCKAGLSQRLSAMPNGLDTILFKDFEPDGMEISGGEAQKIALARALYKNAPFIILDEPTAALDPISEYEIYSKFNEIVRDKTAIYISHRLSSCRFCDEILVFDQGRIVQHGNHKTLVADMSGKYYELWHAQAQYYMS